MRKGVLFGSTNLNSYRTLLEFGPSSQPMNPALPLHFFQNTYRQVFHEAVRELSTTLSCQDTRHFVYLLFSFLLIQNGTVL